VPSEEVTPDPIAFQDDMAHVAEFLESREDDTTLDYIVQFIGGVARSAKDHDLASAAAALAQSRSKGRTVPSEVAHLTGLVQDRLAMRPGI
jgi:hypothetical protein